MKDITIDGVTLTYDEKTDYYIEYDEDSSISGMIDGSFGEEEAIKTFKGARAECRLAKKFINDFGFEVGFEKWCHLSTKDRENFYNELCLKYCTECNMLYDCDCSNTEEDRELCLLKKLEENKQNGDKMENQIKTIFKNIDEIKKEIKDKKEQKIKLEEEIELCYTKMEWLKEDVKDVIKKCFRHVDRITITDDNIEIQVHTSVGIQTNEILELNYHLRKSYNDIKITTKGNYVCLNIAK